MAQQSFLHVQSVALFLRAPERDLSEQKNEMLNSPYLVEYIWTYLYSCFNI